MTLEERLERLETIIAHLNEADQEMRVFILKNKGGSVSEVSKALFALRAGLSEVRELQSVAVKQSKTRPGKQRQENGNDEPTPA